MDTSKMMQIKNLSSQRLRELEEKAARLEREGAELNNALSLQVIRNEIVDVIEENYDLGKVVDLYEIFGGYYNRSFGVVCEKNGQRTDYFVRKYNLITTPADVELEHRLISFVIEQGFKEAAGLYPAKNGATYVTEEEMHNAGTRPRMYAVYVYLGGEDKYTWIRNENTPTEFRNLGALMARFHNSGRKFDPGGLSKVEPRIDEFYKTRSGAFKEMAARPINGSLFHDFYNLSLPHILKCLAFNTISDEEWAKMPLTTIHGDYHAGNVKFTGEETTGLFDLDWAKINYRLFDVCFGLVYCCTSWQVADDGQIRMADCRYFLEGYNETLRQQGGLEPFNETEIKCFPQMMGIAVIYLINWCTSLWYYIDPEGTNDYEAHYYLLHIIREMDWVEEHKSDLERLIREV